MDVTASPSVHEPAIPIVSPVILMYVGHPHIPLFVKIIDRSRVHSLDHAHPYIIFSVGMLSSLKPTFVIHRFYTPL